MARRRRNGIEAVAALPWPVGIVFGILAFVAIRYGVGWYFSASDSPITQELGRQLLATGMYAPLAWMFLAICWLGALLSYLASRKRQRLLAMQTGLDSLRAMSWREFEMLVGEAFSRQGYAVEETRLGGADGGVDLILRKAGRTELVQCKQWRREQISVSVVREMWGLAHHHQADAVKVVCVGEFTREAVGFAEDKPIALIGGEQLVALVREVQGAGRAARTESPRIEPRLDTSPPSIEPTCPTVAAIWSAGPIDKAANRSGVVMPIRNVEAPVLRPRNSTLPPVLEHPPISENSCPSSNTPQRLSVK